MKATLVAMCIVVSAVIFMPGCPKKVEPAAGLDYDRPLPPGKLALRKITDPRDIPDFTAALGSQKNLRPAIDYSLDYMSRPSSQRYFPYGDITHAHAVASLKAFRALLDSNTSAAQLNEEIRQKFDVYISVGCDDRGTVRYTGYYTPIFQASRTRMGKFQHPLYKLPAPSQVTEMGTVAMPGQDRRSIEQGNLLAGQELVYLGDPFEVYIVQVQGSAKLKFIDGGEAVVGFAGTNGMEYKSIRQGLIEDGKIDKDKMSLQAMIAYFKANPQDVSKYTWQNPRYVFFTESKEPYPRGSINQPVIAFRSIATDKSIFPRACLSFIATTLPMRSAEGIVERVYTGFVLDQDTGGAIRAPGRCDIYMGVGENAGDLAGRTVQDGKLYYLFLKSGSDTPPAPQGGLGENTGE